MRQKAVEFATDDNYHAFKEALGFLVWLSIGWLVTFFRDIADSVSMAYMANAATVLTFLGALIRTSYVWVEWRARRKMIAIKKKIREEEAEKVAEENARGERIAKNLEDLLYAPTADEIAEILERNSREKRD